MLVQHLLLLSSLFSLAYSAVVIPRDHPAEPAEETASLVAGCEGEAACGAAVESTAAAEGGEATATYEAATTATAYETAAPGAEETAEVVETAAEEGVYETASPAYEAEPAYETTAAASTTAEVKYGSGSYDWNGFNACIDKCQAQFAPPGGETYAYPAATATATEAPPPPAEMTPPPAEGGEAATKTHTVIVAPTKGVLRYVPFAISAAPGEVIEYVWGAGPHTATEGSQDGICNKTEGGFNSGLMNASATFPETVNDTSTKFVYCSVPTHCQKGMFAVINPPEVPSNVTVPTNTSLAEMLPPMLESNPSLNTKYELAKTACANSTAWTWGDNFEMGGMEAWAMEPAVENILYTRMSYAMNPAAQIDGFNLASFVVPPALDGSSPGGEVVSMSMPVGSSTATAASASGSGIGGASGAQATGDAQSASQSSISGAAHSTIKLSINLLVSITSLVSFFALA